MIPVVLKYELTLLKKLRQKMMILAVTIELTTRCKENTSTVGEWTALEDEVVLKGGTHLGPIFECFCRLSCYLLLILQYLNFYFLCCLVCFNPRFCSREGTVHRIYNFQIVCARNVELWFTVFADYNDFTSARNFARVGPGP